MTLLLKTGLKILGALVVYYVTERLRAQRKKGVD